MSTKRFCAARQSGSLGLAVFSIISGANVASGEDAAALMNKPIEVPAPIVKNSEKATVIERATKVEVSSEESTRHIGHHEGMPSIALALGGGGARGAAHIGVIRVLKEAGIPIDEIVGNSMGAVVGGLYATGLPLDDIQTTLLNKSLYRAYLPAPITVRIVEAPVIYSFDRLAHRYAGLYTGNKYQKLLERKVPEQVRDFDKLKIRFMAVATNLIDGKAYTINTGDVPTAIHASSALSPLLKPVPIGDKLFVDGGVRANLPAYAAHQDGANIVIAVLVDEPIRIMPPASFRRIKGIAARTADIVLAVNDDHQLQYADVIINPDVSSIPVLTRNPDYVRRAVLAGELAARRALPTITRMIKDKQAAGSATAVLLEKSQPNKAD